MRICAHALTRLFFISRKAETSEEDMSEYRFKVGDKVIYGEEVGEVTSVDENCIYLYGVTFSGTNKHANISFNAKGQRYSDDPESFPKIELIEQAKKKVTKRYWQWKICGSAGYYRFEHYMDEEGMSTNRSHRYDLRSIERIKIEDDYVDIEAEE